MTSPLHPFLGGANVIREESPNIVGEPACRATNRGPFSSPQPTKQPPCTSATRSGNL
jgi:hypothetical protein